jgi:hypothetical protein
MFCKHTVFFGLAIVGGILASGHAVADPFLPVPPASFLNYHVSTAKGLSEEVATDVVVRARLARHFGMSQGAVVSYVRENLIEGRLTAAQAGRYRVACITPSGREYFILERLPAGTPVFLLARTGKPILRLACGNPLVSSLPPVPAPVKPKVKAAALVTSQTARPVPIVVTPAVEPTVTVQPAVMSTPIVAVPTTVKVAGATQVLSRGGSAFVPVALGGAAIGLLSHGHSNSPPPPPGPPTAVPEPSTLLLLGIFGGGFIGMKIRERRRRG